MTEYVQDLIFAHFFEHDTAVPGRMEHNRSNCKPRKRFRASLQFLRRARHFHLGGWGTVALPDGPRRDPC